MPTILLMSEPAAAAAPKKKGKMPMIIAVVAVVGGGGFFMMKKNGAPKPKPAVKLGPISDIKEEFLVNLRDNSGVYLRASVSLQFADTVKGEEVEKTMPAIQDLVNARLRSKTLAEIKTLDGTRELKREIAADVNAMMEDKKDTKEGDAEASDKTDEKDSKDSKDSKESKEPEKPKSLLELKMPEGWDSAKGPVLKVLFRSFAWQ